MTIKRLLAVTACAALPMAGLCQGSVSFDRVSSSALKDKDGNRHGSGDMYRYAAEYTLPLSKKLNKQGQPTMWGLRLTASCGVLDNKGEARLLNPDKMVDAGVTVFHMRPLSDRWSLLASAGCGLYADPDDVGWGSLLANGSAIFIYRVRPNLSIGAGGGLTNSFGVPVIMPMLYLNWKAGRRCEVSVDMVAVPKVKLATQLSKEARMELTAIEVEAMSAVTHVEGRERIYSTVLLNSGLELSFKIADHASLYAGAGTTWRRTSRLSKRNIESFFDNFSRNDKDRYHFGSAFRYSIGFRCNF